MMTFIGAFTVTLARKNAATNTPTACPDLARPQPSLPMVSWAITGPRTLIAPLTSALKTNAADAAGITQPSWRANAHPATKSPMTLALA